MENIKFYIEKSKEGKKWKKKKNHYLDKQWLLNIDSLSSGPQKYVVCNAESATQPPYLAQLQDSRIFLEVFFFKGVDLHKIWEEHSIIQHLV